ncbi:MAG: hypothetical protein R3C11_12955 [Planctomycetaceae bacterium]
MSDVFSPVCDLELLTGRHPFRGETTLETIEHIVKADPESLRNNSIPIPIDLQAICLKGLEKNPDQRYRTADDLAEDLQRFLTGKTVNARPAGVIKRSIKWGKRHPFLAMFSTITVVSISLLIGITLIYNSKLNHLLIQSEAGRKMVEEQARQIRERACISDTRLAQIAWSQEDTHKAISLLERHLPQPGEVDVRNFAWWHLWNEYHESARILGRHAGGALSASFSPDNKLIASGGRDATVRIWNLVDYKLLHEWKVSNVDSVNYVQFTPDGQRVVAGCSDGSLQFWDLQNGTHLSKAEIHTAGINQFVFDHTGSRLISAGDDSRVCLIDINSYELVNEFTAHTHCVGSVSLHPSKPIVASTSTDGTIRWWNFDAFSSDQDSSANLIRLPGEHDHPNAVAFSPDGLSLCCTTKEQMIYQWDWAPETRGTLLNSHKRHHRLVTLTWETASGLLAGSAEGVIYEFAISDSLFTPTDKQDSSTRWTFNLRKGHERSVRSIDISGNLRAMVSASTDETVRLWRYSGSALHRANALSFPPHKSLKLVPRRLVHTQRGFIAHSQETLMTSKDGLTRGAGKLDLLPDLDSEAQFLCNIGEKSTFAVSQSGDKLIICNPNGNLSLMDTNSKSISWTRTLPPFSGQVSDYAYETFNSSETEIALCWGKELYLLAVSDGTILKKLTAPLLIKKAIFDRLNPKSLLCCLHGGGILRCDLTTDKFASFLTPGHYIHDFDISDDGKYLAVGRLDGRAVTFTFPELNEVASFSHPDSVVEVKFLNGSSTLLSRSVRVHLWDLASQSELLTFPKPILLNSQNTLESFWVLSSGPAAVSPDHKRLTLMLYDQTQVINLVPPNQTSNPVSDRN